MKRTALAAAAAVSLLVVACSSDSTEPDATIDPELIESMQDLGDDDLLILNGEANDLRIAECASGEIDDGCVALDEAPGSILEPAAPTSEPGVLPEGFSTVLVEITEADGTVCKVCMWLANSADERGLGLMGVTSLGTPVGMAFVWEQPTAGSFFMFETVTPLSIAWFGEPADDGVDGPDSGAGDAGAGDSGEQGGALVSTADMAPCESEDSSDCERFAAGGQYVLAIEVFQGDLESIGITEGATARLLADTEATDCPLR